MNAKRLARVMHLARILDELAGSLSPDDTPLSEAAVPAAIHFIEAIQYGGLTEEQYKEQHPENYLILLRELEPNHPDLQTPTQPEQRRRSRLL